MSLEMSQAWMTVSEILTSDLWYHTVSENNIMQPNPWTPTPETETGYTRRVFLGHSVCVSLAIPGFPLIAGSGILWLY